MRRSRPIASKMNSRQRTNNNKMCQVVAILLVAALIHLAPLCKAAVVRPTVFSDLNASDTTSQQMSPQPPALAGSGQIAPTAPENALQATPSAKINPLKSRFCTAQNGARLDAPIGLQSMAVDDFALSASSSSRDGVGPHLARLNLDIAGGAWCPGKVISSSNFGKEWIQAKLNRSFVVSAIETQGRFGMGNGKEFVPNYQVEYSRNGGSSWHKWKDFRGSSLLRGNEDVNSAVRNELSPPIVGANVIRILPFSQHIRTVCLRFELHGCPYDEGAPIAYETSDGVVEPRWGHLIDYTYDGIRTPHRSLGSQQQQPTLSQGLGQLVDGIKGLDNFSFNNGFEWVGWKSMNGDVVIEFSFKTVRNFTGALFHSNNLFSNGVEVFQGVDVHYGIDGPLSMEALRDSLWEQQRRYVGGRAGGAIARLGRHSDQQPPADRDELMVNQAQTMWSQDVLSIEYEPDKKSESSRPVTVHLKQRLANRLRFVLKFASKWILVSEIEFLSQPVELMSLASLSSQRTPPLLAALTPAKTYDEYVAILREHQLRQIATTAYLESLPNSLAGDSSTPSYSSSVPQPIDSANDQPLELGANQASKGYFFSPAPTRISVTGPAMPPAYLPANPNPSPSNWTPDTAAPATNPALTDLGSIFPFTGRIPNSLANFPSTDSDLSQQQAEQVNHIKQQQQQQQSEEASLDERRTMGLATVISFVLVSILLVLGLLFAVSSYRLRHQPRLGVPLALPRHLAGGKTAGPSLSSFMSVFSSATSGQPGERKQQQQHQPGNPQHYHTLFGTTRTVNEGSTRAANTLKRLASLTSSSTQKNAHPLLSQHQSNANQLLVSVKDSSASPLFGSALIGAGKAKAGQQQVNTQLIVGLNQANPLAQQQIYNNSSNLNCSNQTYATHYSASMSMASSSTTTGHNQADYADYAIPDAQPMVPPMPPAAHLNLAYTGNHQFKQPPQYGLGYLTADSHRVAIQPQQHRHMATLIQPQQQVANSQHQPRRQLANAEHNYELIYQQMK